MAVSPLSGTFFRESEGAMADTNDRGEVRIEALAVISVHRDRASAFADQRIAALAGDLKRQARWQSIRQGIDRIMEITARDAR